MTEKLKITTTDNGPFKVSNLKSMTYCGESQSISGDVYLCRCGESKRAPYCDGRHSEVGFNDEITRTESKQIVIWQGNRIQTRFDPNVCMHVYYCKPLKELRKKELEENDIEAAREIARVVSSCPSGALSYQATPDLNAENKKPPVEIEIVEGGEIRVQTNFEAINFTPVDQQPADKATLCRCGLSANKPFCDGQHRKKENFK